MLYINVLCYGLKCKNTDFFRQYIFFSGEFLQLDRAAHLKSHIRHPAQSSRKASPDLLEDILCTHFCRRLYTNMACSPDAFKWSNLSPLLSKEGLGVVCYLSSSKTMISNEFCSTTPNPSLERRGLRLLHLKASGEHAMLVYNLRQKCVQRISLGKPGGASFCQDNIKFLTFRFSSKSRQKRRYFNIATLFFDRKILAAEP